METKSMANLANLSSKELEYVKAVIADCDDEYNRAQLNCQSPEEDSYYASHSDDFELYCSNVWDEYNNFVYSCLDRASDRCLGRDGLIAIAECLTTGEDAVEYVDSMLA